MSEKIEVSFDKVPVEVEVNDSTAKVVVGDEKLYISKAEEVGISKDILEQTAKFDESFNNAAVEHAVAQAEDVLLNNKEVETVEVVTPFGLTKSSTSTTIVKRAVTSRIPGTDKTVTKSQVKNIVQTNRFVVPKAKLKRLANALSEKVINS